MKLALLIHPLPRIKAGRARIALLFGILCILALMNHALAAVPVPNAQFSGEVVPTFQSLGLYWKTAESADTASVWFRKPGTAPWREGYPLDWDPKRSEYRGSLVLLEPNTAYEIRLSTGDETVATQGMTWNEQFPIAKTIELPASSHKQLTISASGTENGYILYTGPAGGPAVIDGGEYNIDVNAGYVIVRGLTLKNAQSHAIHLTENAHDVVIENNDISGWGKLGGGTIGLDDEAGVGTGYGEKHGVVRIIVQNNKIHHPRYGANAWNQPSYECSKLRCHPLGPKGVAFFHTGGNHVIRYNEIYSSDDKKFNDGIGGGANFSDRGNLVRDSDVYGNLVTHCWDDCIEVEGANMNVRIWNNYVDTTYHGYAVAATHFGPIYLFRNIMDRSYSQAGKPVTEGGQGNMFKVQSDRSYSGELYGGGPIKVFHNTMIHRPGYQPSSVALGIFPTEYPEIGFNVTTRNNSFDVAGPCIKDRYKHPSNDFDYDLCSSGLHDAGGGYHNVKGKPTYESSAPWDSFDFSPGTGSPAVDNGVRLPNFNDDFVGAAPDMGAVERGGAKQRFGIRAE